MTDKQKILAEIERRMNRFKAEKARDEAVNIKVDKLSLGGRIAMLEEIRGFIDSLPEEQPQCLDEAAERYASKLLTYSPKQGQYVDVNSPLRCAFKAGAKWMAEQGFSIEQIVIGDSHRILVPEIPLGKPFEKSDKVTVQIRKKL